MWEGGKPSFLVSLPLSLIFKNKQVMKLIFPQDYTRKPHPMYKNGVQFKPILKTPFFISIVGGAFGLYGDGVKTFELMIGDRVHAFLSINEVNEKVNQVLELLT